MCGITTAHQDNPGVSELDEPAGENSQASILRKFVSAVYGAMERKGLTLKVRTDFAELWALNRQEGLRGAWYPLPPAVNPKESDLTAANSYWIAAETRTGEIVATHACRVFNWPDTNFYEQARAVWYGRDAGQPCTVTSDAARLITGVVTWGVAAWVRPDFRGQQLSYIVPRFSKAYSFAHWPINYSTCFVSMENVRKGLHAVYGHAHTIPGFFYVGWEVVLAYSVPDEFYSDISPYTLVKFLDRSDLEAQDHPRLIDFGLR